MVKGTVYLTEKEQEVIEIIKRKYNMTDSEALSFVLKWYAERILGS